MMHRPSSGYSLIYEGSSLLIQNKKGSDSVLRTLLVSYFMDGTKPGTRFSIPEITTVRGQSNYIDDRSWWIRSDKTWRLSLISDNSFKIIASVD